MENTRYRQASICRLLNVTTQAVRTWREDGVPVYRDGAKNILLDLMDLKNYFEAKGAKDYRRARHLAAIDKLLTVKRCEDGQ